MNAEACVGCESKVHGEVCRHLYHPFCDVANCTDTYVCTTSTLCDNETPSDSCAVLTAEFGYYSSSLESPGS